MKAAVHCSGGTCTDAPLGLPLAAVVATLNDLQLKSIDHCSSCFATCIKCYISLIHRWNTPENIELDWKKFQDKKNSELQRLNGVYDKLLAKAGVKYIEGRGKLVDAHTVDVDGKRYTVRGSVSRCQGGTLWLGVLDAH